MPLLRVLSRVANSRNKPMLSLVGARSMVYHRTSKDKKTRIADYDDGYYYRNGEEQYAQALRNRQAEVLRFDDLYYRISRNKRTFNDKQVDFPNCQCEEDLREYEKEKAKEPRSVTAAPCKDSCRLYTL